MNKYTLYKKTTVNQYKSGFLGENYKANFVEIYQYQQKLQKQRTNSIFIGENYNANFVEIRQNGPSRIRLSGVPLPSTINKNSKNI